MTICEEFMMWECPEDTLLSIMIEIWSQREPSEVPNNSLLVRTCLLQ